MLMQKLSKILISSLTFEMVEDDFVDYADEIKDEDLEIEQQEVEQ